MCRRLNHAPCATGGTEAPAFAGERCEVLMAAAIALNAHEAVLGSPVAQLVRSTLRAGSGAHSSCSAPTVTHWTIHDLKVATSIPRTMPASTSEFAGATCRKTSTTEDSCFNVPIPRSRLVWVFGLRSARDAGYSGEHQSSESLTLNGAIASRREWCFGKSVKSRRRRYGYRKLISVRRTDRVESGVTRRAEAAGEGVPGR